MGFFIVYNLYNYFEYTTLGDYMKKIVLDAGHGGTDPGTIANGIVEKDLTLKITNYIHNRLNELGIPNEVSRNTDITLDPKTRPKKIQSFYGKGNDVVVISNHINAGGGDGAEIIYALRNNDILSSKIAKELEMAGQNVRKYYQRRLPSNPSKDYYYILRDTPNNETVIVEYGFADSKGDDVEKLKNNWEELAEAVTKAIVEYAGGIYKTNNDSNYYTVKKGDTLYSIAKKLNVDMAELKNINNLVSNLISVGQNLIIPVPDTTEEYIVKKGDTLYSIAQKFNTTVDNLKSINKQITDNLSIGQIIKLPENIKEDLTNSYIVKKGDTLYSIAQKFDTTVDNLIATNNLTNPNLSIGQIIKLDNSKIYTVLKDDTLYSIAKKFNTSINEIMDLNNLESIILSIGQKLLIP